MGLESLSESLAQYQVGKPFKMLPGFSLPFANCMHGGYLASLAYIAATHQASFTRPIHQHMHFFGRCIVGSEINIEVTPLSKSKRFETIQINFYDQKCIFSSQLMFANNLASTHNYTVKKAPNVAPISACHLFHHPLFSEDTFFQRIHVYLIEQDKEFMKQKKDQLSLSGWFQWPDQRPIQPEDIPFICDAHGPLPFFKYGATVGWVPTLTMDIQTRRYAPVKQLKFQVKANFITDNIIEEDLELWSPDDKIVSLSRQMAYIQTRE